MEAIVAIALSIQVLGGVVLLSIKRTRNWIVKASRAVLIIDEELQPNGGKSIKDRIDKLEFNQQGIIEKLNHIEDRIDAISEIVIRKL